jgi:plasmid stabilization system protein ParE
VADRHARVDLTASFIERLESIEAFLSDARAPQAYDKLLDDLRRIVIPNLRRFPRIGRRYLDHPPQSAEALAQLRVLPSGAADALREYLHGDYLILYTLTGSTVYLLSIRHHRQLTFAFSKLWEP